MFSQMIRVIRMDAQERKNGPMRKTQLHCLFLQPAFAFLCDDQSCPACLKAVPSAHCSRLAATSMPYHKHGTDLPVGAQFCAILFTGIDQADGSSGRGYDGS